MKPADCAICGISCIEEPEIHKGDWVEFSDYVASDGSSLDDPEGLEYFCGQHLPAAKLLAGKTAKEALTELKLQFTDTALASVCPLGVWWCKHCAMKQKPSELLHKASVLFAWGCWTAAYWKSNLWWVAVSLIPYILSNGYGHLLDKDGTESARRVG